MSTQARLAGSVRRCFGTGDYTADANAVAHHRDLAAAFGVGFDPLALTSRRGSSHTAMCLAMLEELGELGEPDLVILAHTAPDIDVTGAAALALASRLKDEPPAFAVGGQGAATSFTALHIAAEYLRCGDARRVLVLLLDQAALPYRVPVPAPLRSLADTAVALMLTASDSPGLAVARLGDVDPADAPARLARMLKELTPQGAAASVVTGPGIDASWDVPRPHVQVKAGRPTTGLWDLEPRDGACVLVADYDHQLRYLCAAAIEDATGPGKENET